MKTSIIELDNDFQLKLRANDFINWKLKQYKQGISELPHPNSEIQGEYCFIPSYGKFNLFNIK